MERNLIFFLVLEGKYLVQSTLFTVEILSVCNRRNAFSQKSQSNTMKIRIQLLIRNHLLKQDLKNCLTCKLFLFATDSVKSVFKITLFLFIGCSVSWLARSPPMLGGKHMPILYHISCLYAPNGSITKGAFQES